MHNKKFIVIENLEKDTDFSKIEKEILALETQAKRMRLFLYGYKLADNELKARKFKVIDCS